MSDAYVFDHVRTPRGRGRSNGGLHPVPPVEMAAQVLAALRERNRLDPELVEEVVLGCVNPIGEQGADIARPAALMALGQSVPGVQIDRYCSSSLDAVNMVAAQVMAGQLQLAIAGGVESMSRIPIGSQGGAYALDPKLVYDLYFTPVGIAADLIATRSGFSRTDVDAYSAESHRRAARAWSEGRFAKSVIPVRDALGRILLDRDEAIRPDTTVEALAKLEPSFAKMGQLGGYNGVVLQRYPEVLEIDHVHTPANSSGIVDGASGVLIGSKAAGEQLGLKPRARIRAYAAIGCEPSIQLLGPAPATLKALKLAGLTPADVDLFELNEAFASMVLEYKRVMGVPHEKINVNGGAIAMGHPLGATGAMIMGTALDELERTGGRIAVVALCVGLGMGTATVIERL